MGDQPLSPKIGYGGLFIREWHRFEKLCISTDLEPILKYLCQFLKFIFKSIDKLYSYNPYKASSMSFLKDFYALPSSNEPGPDYHYYTPILMKK